MKKTDIRKWLLIETPGVNNNNYILHLVDISGTTIQGLPPIQLAFLLKWEGAKQIKACLRDGKGLALSMQRMYFNYDNETYYAVQ